MWGIAELPKSICDDWVRQKHYSRNPSIFWKGFGLVIGGEIQGVVVYGQPSPPIQKHAFKDRDFRLYELSRLVIQTDAKNAASFLVGGSLRLLATPCAVVSYADTQHGHSGIVYQATNWIYTGATKSHDKLYKYNGQLLHPMTLRDMGITAPIAWAKENNVEVVAPKPKHRYFMLLGDRRQKKTMLSKLAYKIIKEYPKSGKTTYDAGPQLHYKWR